jgi:hypothetical protein
MAQEVFYYNSRDPFPDFLSSNTIEVLNDGYKQLENENVAYTANPLNLANSIERANLQWRMQQIQEKKYKLITDEVYQNLRDGLGYMTPDETSRLKQNILQELYSRFPGSRIPQRGQMERLFAKGVTNMIREREQTKEGDGLKLKRMLKYDIHSKRHSKV